MKVPGTSLVPERLRIAQGRTNKEIAAQLELAERTVEARLFNVIHDQTEFYRDRASRGGDSPDSRHGMP
jgi:hypothetical protein